MILVQLKNFKVKGFDIFTENHFLVMFVMNVLQHTLLFTNLQNLTFNNFYKCICLHYILVAA